VRATTCRAGPFTRDGERTADAEPFALEIEAMLWRIEELSFDAEGEWNVLLVDVE